MGSLHISEIEIERYRERTLAPAELLAVNDHVLSCDVCHQRLVGKGRVGRTYRFVREELEAALEENAEHLRFEQIVAYATGQVDAIDREILETHIEECPDCDAEIADIRLYNSTVALRPPRGPAPDLDANSLRFIPNLKPAERVALQIAAMIAIAILAGGIATVLLSRRTDRLSGEVERLRGSNETLTAQLAQLSPSSPDKQSPLAKEAEQAQPTTAPLNTTGNEPEPVLKDGGRPVRLDDKGKLEAGGAIPEKYLGIVGAALKFGRLSIPAPLTGSGAGQTRSASQEDPFHLLSPAGVTLSDRPDFKWTPLADAVSYSVEVRDSDTDQEIESNKLIKPEWTAEKPLERGHKYSWAVIATLNDGKHVIVPSAGSPSAVFAVLPGATLTELQRAKSASKGSHLLLAVLYAKQGLIPEARRELKALSTENPHSKIIERLRRSLDVHGA